MNTDKHRSAFICTTKVEILCRLERILLRGFFALFASSRLFRTALSPLRREGRKENAKGPSENKVCILARAPGGQMQGAATQAMWGQRRGAATPQMPARRRAPPGCRPQARWLCCSLLTYRSGYARRSRLASGPGGQQQNVHLIS